ncbi:MAG: hypothetical protein WC654_01735 [Patescibacteria group bacterium]
MSNLRLVRKDEACQPVPQDEDRFKDDPRVVALLDRMTLGRGLGEKFIFASGDVELLLHALVGMSFTDDDLIAIEAWLCEHNPYRPNRPNNQSSVEACLGLVTLVAEEVERVASPRWLEEPLNRLYKAMRMQQVTRGVNPNWRLLCAALVAFYTVRDPRSL